MGTTCLAVDRSIRWSPGKGTPTLTAIRGRDAIVLSYLSLEHCQRIRYPLLECLDSTVSYKFTLNYAV